MAIMFTRGSMVRTGCALGLVGALALADGCSSGDLKDDGPIGHEEGVGEVRIAVTLSDGSEVGEIQYVLTRGETQLRMGTIAVGGDGRASAVLTSLPVAEGYVISLTAMRTGPAGALGCAGTSLPFVITAGTSTMVYIALNCDRAPSQNSGDANVEVIANVCPTVSATVNPSSAPVGWSVTLTAMAEDPDGDTIRYTWSASSGRFSSPNTANTTYTCTAEGEKQINLTVSDGDSVSVSDPLVVPASPCAKTLAPPIVVTCTPAVADAGAGNGGAQPDAGADSGADIDSGPPADSGTPVVDSGTPVVDSGRPVVDSGTPVVDSGTLVVDSGTPVVDSGTPVVDSGTPVVDSGTPVVDSGMPVVDSGTQGGARFGTAGCDQCLQANCNPYFGFDPVLADCQDAACEQAFTCFQSNRCAIDVSSVHKCYCGPIEVGACVEPGFDPNGPCADLVEQGLGVGTDPQVVLGEFYSGLSSTSDGIKLFNCAAELCIQECVTGSPPPEN